MAINRRKGLEQLRKQLSDGALSMLSEQPDKKVVPTGIATLDSALGVGGFVRGQQVITYGLPAGGKALKNGEPVLTPDGFVPIESLKVGDCVIGASGRKSNVIGVFPQGKKHLNRVIFSNGTEVVCSDDHIWRVRRKSNVRNQGDCESRTLMYLERDMTLSEIADAGLYDTKPSHKFYVQPHEPIEREFASLPIDPYVLGVLIGDGSLHCSTPKLTNTEKDIVDRVSHRLPDNVRMKKHNPAHKPSYYTFVKVEKSGVNTLAVELEKIGLNVGSANKFIPSEYLNASIAQRVDLLRGLCDTDGYVYADKERVVEWSTVSPQLRDDFIELVCSLGGMILRTKVKENPHYTDGDGNVIGHGLDAYVVFFRFPQTGICPVSSTKHLMKINGSGGKHPGLNFFAIDAIEDAGYGDCTCIAIDDPTHCYITRGHIPTHNTALAYTAIGNLMKRDPDAMACIIDVERAADQEWMMKFGIDPERTAIIREPTVEDDVNAFQKAIRSGAFDYIVVDSLGAVIRSRDFDGKDGKGGDANVAQVGGSAGAITRMVNKANAEMINLDKMEVSGTEVIKPVIIFINQARANFNSMYGGITMSGGYALEHMSNVVIRVSASGAANDKMWGTVGGKKVQVGTRVTCKLERNKNAPKDRLAGYDFCWEECPEHEFGIDSASACLDLAIEYGAIEARGAWLYYGTEGQEGYVKMNGRAAMLEAFRDNPEFMEAVYAATMELISEENDELMEAADE